MATLKFKCPEGTSSVSVSGDTYNADKNGVFEADESIFQLISPHGFTIYNEPEAPAEAPAAEPTAKKKASGTKAAAETPAETTTDAGEAPAEAPAAADSGA